MKFETKKVLITVKAYPNPSRRYTETVCTAGIDLTKNKWIRLYPVPFRDLEIEKKFKKYDIIQVEATKATNDPRPESYKIRASSIKVIGSLSTAEGWKARKEYILPLASKSMCEIAERCQREGISLGLFKPNRKVDLTWEPVPRNWKPGAEERYAQLSLFNPQKEVLDKIPYIFRLHYFCLNEPECKGHNQCIVDWEIGEAFRSWKLKYHSEEIALQKIKCKWQKQIFGEDRDSYLFVGNQFQYKTFMVLGIFWPPKSKSSE